MNASLAGLFNAVAFAARAHRGQTRKDGVTPYVSHSMRVCLVVRCVFGFDDPELLTAAVLHDTIEDTTTDYDDIAEHFGERVAGWVAALSKDKRLPDDRREDAYADAVVAGGWQVQVLKLADIYDNLGDPARRDADGREKAWRRARFYLDRLAAQLAPEALPAFEIVRAWFDATN